MLDHAPRPQDIQQRELDPLMGNPTRTSDWGGKAPADRAAWRCITRGVGERVAQGVVNQGQKPKSAARSTVSAARGRLTRQWWARAQDGRQQGSDVRSALTQNPGESEGRGPIGGDAADRVRKAIYLGTARSALRPIVTRRFTRFALGAASSTLAGFFPDDRDLGR